MIFVHWCTAKTNQPSVFQRFSTWRATMKVGNKFFMQEGTSRVLNFPAHKIGIVSCWYSICTQRYKCVKVCVCSGGGGVLWRMEQSPTTFFSFKCTHMYLVILLWKLFFFFFVCAWAHTLLVIMVSEVCDVLEWAHMLDGRMTPASEPTLKIMPSFYESQPEKERKGKLEQKHWLFTIQRHKKILIMFLFFFLKPHFQW